MRSTAAALVLASILLAPDPLAAQDPDDRRPGQVSIYRDDYGVPHIYAALEEDAFYGLGYAQAEDQLEYVLRMYLAARGELAVWFGQESVQSDVQARTWMHAEEARAGYEGLPSQLRRNYAGYVAGLERYMRDHPEAVPEWAPSPEPWDPVAASRLLLWGSYMAGDGLMDCQRGGVRLSEAAEADLGRRAGAASNQWVLAPWRTADDATIVLSDPHGGIDGAFVYESRIDAGALKAAGYSQGPALLLTHTRHASWAMTTGAPDVADCFEVEVDPGDPRRFRFDGEWRTMETRELTIPVRDGESVTHVAEYTRHNGVLSPVVARQDGKAYVVSSPYMHDAGAFDEEVYRLNLARDVDEIREAMSGLGMFAQNLMFGTRDGETLYVRAGRTPRRPGGFDYSRPVPGNSSESAWQGTHPLDELVVIESPPQGYMQNNNLSPDMMMEGSPASADRYPSYVFNDRPGRTNARGLRSIEVLAAATAFTVDDAIDLSLDERWYRFGDWQRALRAAMDDAPDEVRSLDPEERRLAQRVMDFNGDARAESVHALSFFYWRTALSDGLSEDQLRALVGFMWGDAAWQPELGPVLLEAVRTGTARMVEGHGNTDVRYGDVFRIGRDERTWPLGGGPLLESDRSRCQIHHLLCIPTLRAFNFAPADSLGQRRAVTGSRLLRLVVFTDPIQSWTLHVFGQSGHPDSPHYVDQARLSSQRRLKPVYFEKDELMRHTTRVLTLDTEGMER